MASPRSCRWCRWSTRRRSAPRTGRRRRSCRATGRPGPARTGPCGRAARRPPAACCHVHQDEAGTGVAGPSCGPPRGRPRTARSGRPPPCRDAGPTSAATQPIRRTLRSRSALLKPSPAESSRRTTSPSSRVTVRSPVSRSESASPRAIVDLPEPEKPVKKTTRPRCRRGGRARASSLATAGGVCHSGSGKPRSSRSSISAGVMREPAVARRDVVAPAPLAVPVVVGQLARAPAPAGRRRRASRRWRARGSRRTRRRPGPAAARRASRRRGAAAAPPRSWPAASGRGPRRSPGPAPPAAARPGRGR